MFHSPNFPPHTLFQNNAHTNNYSNCYAHWHGAKVRLNVCGVYKKKRALCVKLLILHMNCATFIFFRHAFHTQTFMQWYVYYSEGEFVPK